MDKVKLDVVKFKVFRYGKTRVQVSYNIKLQFIMTNSDIFVTLA
jgi:hypothetical protein